MSDTHQPYVDPPREDAPKKSAHVADNVKKTATLVHDILIENSNYPYKICFTNKMSDVPKKSVQPIVSDRTTDTLVDVMYGATRFPYSS